MCLAEQLFVSERWTRGRTAGRDPCGGAMRRTEAALSPGVPGGQAVVLDMLILSNGSLQLDRKKTHLFLYIYINIFMYFR